MKYHEMMSSFCLGIEKRRLVFILKHALLAWLLRGSGKQHYTRSSI